MIRRTAHIGARAFAALALTSHTGLARADEADYLSVLQPKFAFVSTQQLITEGHRICASVNGGQRGVDTIAMVVKDLGMSETEAIDTITAAMTKLPC